MHLSHPQKRVLQNNPCRQSERDYHNHATASADAKFAAAMRLVPETAIDPRLMPWATIVKPLLAAFLNLRCRHQAIHDIACRQSERNYHNPATADAVAANPHDIQAAIANFNHHRKILIEYK